MKPVWTVRPTASLLFPVPEEEGDEPLKGMVSYKEAEIEV